MKQWKQLALLIVVLLALALVLAGCQAPIGDPYQLGQWVRQEVEQLIGDLREFLAGFCGMPPAALLLGIPVLLRWRAK